MRVRFYACSLQAEREGAAAHDVRVVVAPSKMSASVLARNAMHAMWPTEDGWRLHNVKIEPVPDEPPESFIPGA